MNKSQQTDPIIEEIHQHRREVAERFHGDVHAIAADAAARMAASNRPVWKAEKPEKLAEITNPI